MNESFKRLYKGQCVKIALYLVIVFILVDTFLTYQYKQALTSNIATQATLDEIAARKRTIISNLNNVDMSLRGYLLVGNEAFIGTYQKIKDQSIPNQSHRSPGL